MTPATSPAVEAKPAVAGGVHRNPWLWVPSLYFSQGVPYVIVMTMSVVMYKRLGVSNTDIALYTSWLYLPWVIKPLWSPFVDITRTKRFWVVTMQCLISLGLASVAFSVRGSAFFKWSLFLFWIMAFASATHDIAADGFYMLSMSPHEQAWWVGLRSTFYRTAMIVGSGLLVVLAGVLESKNGLAPLEIPVKAVTENATASGVGRSSDKVEPKRTASPRDSRLPIGVTFVAQTGSLPYRRLATGVVSAGGLGDFVTSPGGLGGDGKSGLEWEPVGQIVAPNEGELRLIPNANSLEIPIADRSAVEAQDLVDRDHKWNSEHGFLRDTVVARHETSKSWWSDNVSAPLSKALFEPIGAAWTASVSGPLKDFLAAHFPKPAKTQSTSAGNVAAIYWTLSRPPAQDQQVVVTFDRKKRGLEYLGLAKGDKGFRLVEGERLVFDATNWNVPAMAVIQLDPRLDYNADVVFIGSSGNIPAAWSITLFVVAGLFLAFCCWHGVMLPHPANDGPVVTDRGLAREFFATLGSFFRKPGIAMAIAFFLLYRFDEAQLTKVISPFLLDGRDVGGLGLTTSQVGVAYGTFGILALTCGGLLGGFLAAKNGLKTMLPYMLCAMYLPKLAFVFLSFVQPENFLVTCGAVAVEQLGYGFGFTAFMLYMLYFADGPHKTAHYAICTGFMALGMMIPGMWSGWIADIVGYRHFFVWVICSAIPGFTLALLLKVDPQFGKKAGPNK